MSRPPSISFNQLVSCFDSMMGSGDSEDSNTYGVLCHRQYSDRVRYALLYNNSFNWLQLSSSHCSDSQQISQTSNIVDIPTSDHKGPRKDRSGYSLFVIHNATISPGHLPPMARKQISWAGRLQHQFSNFGTINNSSEDTMTYKHLIIEIWKELSKTYNATQVYRVDVQPKSYSSEIITAFITYINEILQDKKINLSLSASKATHVVNIVIHSTTTDAQQSSSPDITQQSPIQAAYWGISNAREHFTGLNQRLNDNANKDIIIETTDETTGVDKRVMNDSSQDVVDVNVPVSRAYYKLAQVFEDESLIELIGSLHNGNKGVSKKSILYHGAGLDIGASPGGWTQVLYNNLGLSSVVAVDPGILANRVMKLNGVHHIRAELSTDTSIKGLANHAPYSVIVCDASISDANELLVKIVETLKKVSLLLNEEERGVIALPLCLVITLKLPYKTAGSIERNLEKVNNYIPEYLGQIAKLGGDNVVVRHNICHLFANSASERSLVAVFHNKK